MLPWLASRTLMSGMDALMMPVIGPTASKSWHWPNSISPVASIFCAFSAVSVQPSYNTAPIIAPCIGPHMSCQATGGPACKSKRVFFNSGQTLSARKGMSSHIGRALMMRLVASALALSIRGSCINCANCQASNGSALPGGCHCRFFKVPPCATTLWLKPSIPMFNTAGICVNKLLGVIMNFAFIFTSAGELFQ